MNNPKRIRVISLMVAVVFSFMSMLAGCGTNVTSPATTAKETAGAQATTAAAATETLPEVKLNWYIVTSPNRDKDAVYDEVNKMVKEKINATIEFTEINWGEYDDKMKVLVTSGEEIDLLFTANWAFSFAQNAAKGYFMPINDLLDTYGKDIKANFPQDYWSGVTIDNKIYAVNGYQGIIQPKGITFRKDLVEKYGFDVSKVKKLTDIEPFLEAVKNGEPDIVPWMAFGKSMVTYQPEYLYTGDDMLGAVQYEQLTNFLWIDDKNQMIIDPFQLEEYQNYFKTLRDWYQKDYIAKDAATYAESNDDRKAGKYAAYRATGINDEGQIATETYGIPYINSAPLAYPVIGTSALQGTLAAIGSNSKNPERAMMLLNLLWTEDPGYEIYNTLCYGLENTHYKVLSTESDGRKIVETIPDSGYAGVPWEYGAPTLFAKWYTKSEGKAIYEKYKEHDTKAMVSPIVGFAYNGEAMKTETAQIDNVLASYMPLLLTGTMDVDKALTEMGEKLKKAGSEKVIADAQKQLDDWKKSNNK